VRILVWLVTTKKAKVLIYSDPTHYLWNNTEFVLNHHHQIKVVHFNGPVHHMNRKRQRMEEDHESRTVMFLPDSHLEGTNFGFVTHVLVVGKVYDQRNYDLFLGRATRMGRTEPLTIIDIKSSTQE
jgi:hypothetical protein